MSAIPQIIIQVLFIYLTLLYVSAVILPVRIQTNLNDIYFKTINLKVKICDISYQNQAFVAEMRC